MVHLLDKEELQDKLDEATRENIPHYHWHLPELKDVVDFELPDNINYDPDISPKDLNCVVQLGDRIQKLKDKYGDLPKVNAQRKASQVPNDEVDPDNPTGPSLLPHPNSDFNHIDPGALGDNPEAEAKVRKKVKNALDVLEEFLKDGAERDGELKKIGRTFAEPLRATKVLVEEFPGNNPNETPKGMKRLRLVFEWMLCQVTTIFGEINMALDDKDGNKYTAARGQYIDLLKDLDNREPETAKNIPPKTRPVEPGLRGYGRAVKWFYVLPLISGGRIKGAKVMAKWNPHISSSGIPIIHQ